MGIENHAVRLDEDLRGLPDSLVARHVCSQFGSLATDEDLRRERGSSGDTRAMCDCDRCLPAPDCAWDARVPQGLRALRGFPLALLNRLVNTLRSEVLAEGQAAVSKGEVCSKLLIVRDGECTVSSSRGATRTLSAGDSFGHDGFLHGMPAAETVVASTKATLWALDADATPQLQHWLAQLRARHALVRQHASVTPAQLRLLHTVGKSTTATVQVRDPSCMRHMSGGLERFCAHADFMGCVFIMSLSPVVATLALTQTPETPGWGISAAGAVRLHQPHSGAQDGGQKPNAARRGATAPGGRGGGTGVRGPPVLRHADSAAR